MRCKICGRKLKKEGDICKNCYQQYKKEQKLKYEKEEELLRINRKYSPKFNLLKSGEMIVLLLIIILAGFSYYSTLIAILILILCLFLLGFWMFFCKKRAKGTKTIFYETKMKYRAKYFFVDREEIIPYEDVKDASYFQTRSQKICHIADVRFYTKGFLQGLTIADVPNIEENFKKMEEIIIAYRNLTNEKEKEKQEKEEKK